MTGPTSGYRLKLAAGAGEIAAAQRLRHRVFVEEFAARPAAPDGLERDGHDPVFDHLLVLDQSSGRVAATCRMGQGPDFASAALFDLAPLRRTGLRLLELGRACVDPAHRGGPAMLLLWHGLAAYASDHGAEVIFGAASFHGTDPRPAAPALSWLLRHHPAPPGLAAPARADAERVPRDLLAGPGDDAALPPLIRAYLRLGGRVGPDVVIDRSFNTIDVFMTMKTSDFKSLPGVLRG
jgi:putative hemolysin